jgi:hypothetical protein
VIVDRVGPAAAFLRRSQHSDDQGQTRPAMPALKWSIPEKISFYQRHKSGHLRKISPLTRFISKTFKLWNEHRLIANHPNHLSLANQVARSLHKQLPQ